MRTWLRVPWMLDARAGLLARETRQSVPGRRARESKLALHTVRIKVDPPEGSFETRTLIGAMWKRSNALS